MRDAVPRNTRVTWSAGACRAAGRCAPSRPGRAVSPWACSTPPPQRRRERVRPTATVGLSGARVGFALVCDPDAMPRIARGEGGADRGVNTNSAPAGVSVSPRRCARGADTNGGASGRRERRAAPAGAGLAQGGCARRRGGIRQAEGPMTRLPLPSALWAPAQPDLSLSGPMQSWHPGAFIYIPMKSAPPSLSAHGEHLCRGPGC